MPYVHSDLASSEEMDREEMFEVPEYEDDFEDDL
jgi:hypothetical protein